MRSQAVSGSILSFFIFSFLLSGCNGEAQKRVSSLLPYQTSGTLPLIQVTLPNGLYADFILDTGAEPIIITNALASQLKLKPQFQRNGRGDPLYFLPGTPAKTVDLSFKIGDVPFSGSVMVVDESKFEASGVDVKRVSPVFGGLIGTQALKHLAILIDPAYHQVTLTYPGKLSRWELKLLRMEDAVVVPLHYRSAVGGESIIALIDKTVKADLDIDTGGDVTTLPSNVINLLKLKPIETNGLEHTLFGTVEASTTRISRLDIGSLQIKNVIVNSLKQEYPRFGPSLGMDILSHLRVLIDYPNALIYLKPISTRSDRHPHKADYQLTLPESSLRSVQKLHVPLSFDPLTSPFPVVYARIDHSGWLPFLIDTSESGTVTLSPQIVNQLHLTTEKRRFHDTQQHLATLARLQSFELQSRTTKNGMSPAYPLPLEYALVREIGISSDVYSGAPLAGSIGMGLLDRMAAVEFDFASHELTLFPNTVPPPHSPASVRVPLTKEGPLYTLPLGASHGNVINCVVATNQADFISLSADEAGAMIEQAKQHVSGIGIRDKEQVPATLYLFDALQLGALTLRNEVVSVEQTRSADQARTGQGRIGTKLLSQHRLIFDFRHDSLIFEPAVHRDRNAFLPGYTGALLLRSGSHYQVAILDAGSPARLAGLRIGDEVVSVDGRSPDTLSVVLANNLLRGFAGTQARVKVGRPDGTTNTIIFQRSDLFSAPPDPKVGVGISVALHDAGRMVITEVAANSSAQAAGLQSGDEILAVNGMSVSSTPMAQIVAALKQPEGTLVILSIRRKQESHLREVRLIIRRLQ